MNNSKKQSSLNKQMINGYTGNILRIDLSTGKSTSTSFDEDTLRKYVGGATLGIKNLYDEVPPRTEWSNPENRLLLFSGPLGGTRIGGSGAIAVVTVGALTNGIASTQANGFFGAFLRLSGYDGIILQGVAPDWVYLHIHDGIAEIKDARHLLGQDTFEVDRIIKEELGKKERETSIICIGPAGEKLVRFACISADHGHVAAHNGVGAVMGSKRLKAIAVDRGRHNIPLYNKEAVSRLAGEIHANMMADNFYDAITKEGTLSGVIQATKAGFIPTKNYTTSVHKISDDKLEAYSPQNIRRIFDAKPSPCWACSSQHCHMGKITKGKYAGRIVEEPEFEGLATFSSLLGIDDATTSIVLANEVDRLGIDTNEAGWVISWVMECYERGMLSKKDVDGLEMTWGNSDAIMAMLKKITNRQGFGDILAEGVMRAAQRIGGETPNMAIYTLKGNTPRSHDHRAMWLELFDTCVSNTGTLETHSRAPLKLLGLPETYDAFDPEMISTVEAKIKGAMLFDDSLVACRFQTATALELLCQAINAATGWDMDFQEAMLVGKRAVNLARVFNLRQGISAKLDAPSVRYGSTPHDGIAAGRGISDHWDMMLSNYYQLMGWDEKTGKPLPETLSKLGLDFAITQL